MTPKIPPLDLTEAEWQSLRTPERMLMVAAELCDVDHVHDDPPGSHRSPWIDAMLEAARTDVGQPWCAAFVTYCLKFAGRDIYSPDYGKGVRYPASVASWVDWAKAAGKWSRTPKRGRAFAIRQSGESHMGLVTKANPDGTFETIEGNTSGGDSSKSRVVGRHTRSIRDVSGFIDLT